MYGGKGITVREENNSLKSHRKAGPVLLSHPLLRMTKLFTFTREYCGMIVMIFIDFSHSNPMLASTLIKQLRKERILIFEHPFWAQDEKF